MEHPRKPRLSVARCVAKSIGRLRRYKVIHPAPDRRMRDIASRRRPPSPPYRSHKGTRRPRFVRACVIRMVVLGAVRMPVVAAAGGGEQRGGEVRVAPAGVQGRAAASPVSPAVHPMALSRRGRARFNSCKSLASLRIMRSRRFDDSRICGGTRPGGPDTARCEFRLVPRGCVAGRRRHNKSGFQSARQPERPHSPPEEAGRDTRSGCSRR